MLRRLFEAVRVRQTRALGRRVYDLIWVQALRLDFSLPEEGEPDINNRKIKSADAPGRERENSAVS
jgi:hypothetical protein